MPVVSEWWLVATMTGKKLARVLPVSCPWGTRIGDAEGGRATFKLGIVTAAVEHPVFFDWEDLTREWARSIVPYVNGKPQYFGIITDSDYDGETQTLVVDHYDFWTLLGYRSTLGIDGYSRVNFTDILADYTLASILKMVFRLTFEGPTGANYLMNVQWDHILPDRPDVPNPHPHDGTETRIYYDYNLPKMLDTLEELMSALGGPEVAFTPVEDENHRVRLVMRIGSQAAPLLTGPTLSFWWGVPQPSIFHLRRRTKGSGMANVLVATGAGSELDRKYATATAGVDAEMPALEGFTSYPQLTTDDALVSHARADVAAKSKPIIQWSFSILMGGTIGLLDLVLGQPVRIYTQNEPLLGTGWHAMRVVGWSADIGEEVTVQVQPIGGA